MTITAKSITTSNTLEQLRNQFNNLVTDVDGLESGSKTFSSIVATESSATTLNVLEDGTIIFEGATDDAFETTLTVADPTADRTITFPDNSGTVVVSGTGGLTVADGGNIGSDSDTDAISISAAGVVAFSATTANTNASDGAVTVAGGVGIAADLSVGDDLRLISDSAVLSFGADSDTTLTHTDGSGLTLNSTNKLMFNDASQFIQGASATVLDIAATDEIELTATLIDVVGNLATSGTGTFGGILKTDDATDATSTTDGSLQTDGGLSVVKDAVFGDDVMLLSDSAVLKFGADSDINITHVADTGLTTNGDFTVGDDLTISGGVVDVKNTGAQSVVRFYCESGNAHYTEIQAAAHSDYSGNVTVTLPVTAGTLATTATAADEATALAIALG